MISTKILNLTTTPFDLLGIFCAGVVVGLLVMGSLLAPLLSNKDKDGKNNVRKS